MEKRKKWHFYLILSVLVFAFYNIIPTIVYYTRPLHKIIDSKEASNIAYQVASQVKKDKSFLLKEINKIISCLNLSPKSIRYLGQSQSIVEVSFSSEEEAKNLVTSLIYGEKTFVGSSLPLFLDNVYIDEKDAHCVVISSKNFLSISKDQFSFIPKMQDKKFSSTYLDFLENKSDQIVYTALNISQCSFCEEYSNVNQESISVLEDLENYRHLFSQDYYKKVIVPFIICERKGDIKACIQRELAKEESLFDKEFLKDLSSLCEKMRSNEVVIKGIKKSFCRESFFYKFSQHEHPLFESILINVNSGSIDFCLNKDVIHLRNSLEKSQRDLLTSFISKEISKIENRNLSSGIVDKGNFFKSQLIGIGKSSGLLVIDNKSLSHQCKHFCSELIRSCWKTKTVDLSLENYPIFFDVEPKNNSPLGCYIFSKKNACSHFPRDSVVIFFKDLHSIVQSILSQEDAQAVNLKADLARLYNLFAKRGFSSQKIHQDQVFYMKTWEPFLSSSTKEKFLTLGNHIVLETFDVKHRLLLNNKINTESHEELVKWYDNYQKSKNRMGSKSYLEVFPLAKNIFYENLKLNIKKYFSGDERKILKWGLDLSGGKTVKICFKDNDNKILLNTKEVDRAAEELSQRLNRLGVSEILVRREGNFVNVDFPSNQNIPAEDLVTSSSMRFHVVNEKFSCLESPLYPSAKMFLDKVWSIASSQKKYDSLSLNKIARDLLNQVHLKGTNATSQQLKMLVEEGLNIPEGEKISREINSKYSWIVRCKEAKEGVNPLVIVYYNYALEGADLANIVTNFDAKEGNVLQFAIKKSMNLASGEKINPSEEFYKWTSLFSTSAINCSELAKYSSGRGWRMAVILNDLLVTAPQLNSPLSDHAQITGAFSQRDVLKLASDLKMGTMTYKPVIMAEDTISPELGLKQKVQGILAATLGLLAVIVVMCTYYRVAGFIAVIAVILNLIIIWGILQSIGAVLTLSGIAGIILAMGMAVDSNVLVFERIREELRLSEGLPQAIKVGFKRAFGAILDSNITTILAAFILLLFDVGPIKGFALTLIIGILSSMFTSLFMTKFFFSYWLEHSQKAHLTMSSLFINTKLNFIKGARRSWIFSIVLVVIGGCSLFLGEIQTLLSIDFKGGYVLSLNNIQEHDIANHVPQLFKTIGISSSDFQLRSLNQNKKVKIYFSNSAINQLKTIDTSSVDKCCDFEYQKDRALSLIVDVLQQSGVSFDKETLTNLHLSWSGVSGQFSKTMKKQAILGVFGALLIVLIYVCMRFEIAYAISSVIALVHDLLVTCAILVIAHCFVKSIQFDFQTIGALMTVLGYSLNNTIIIFDRIREREIIDTESFDEIVRKSINSTFSRTMMTTITTLVVILSLLVFGGHSLLGFSLTMISGVLLGALSSIYLAPALLMVIRKNLLFTSKKKNLFQLRK